MAGSPQPPQVYFILGTPGAGRRAIIADLIENGLGADERALLLVAEDEASDPADARLAARPGTEVRRWRWVPPVPPADPELPAMKLPAGPSIFFLADSRASPIDQLEALKPWLARQGARLARVFCVVDCRLAEQTPALRPWFEACIHFADVVFLTHRAGVANKWLSDFLKHFKTECFPCHFLMVKSGGIPNPALYLDPVPRRVSQYFDEAEAPAGVEIESDEEDEDEEAAAEFAPPPEPYFERLRSGRRVRELPDIRDYPPAKSVA